MTEEQKTTQENAETPFDAATCKEMFERMMAQQGEACNCAELMSEAMAQMMSQMGSDGSAEMMGTCCVTQREEEK